MSSNVFTTTLKLAAGCLLCCLIAAPSALAVEGMGAHRGSFMLLPYWTTKAPMLTVFRVVNAVEKEDPSFPDNDFIPPGNEEGKEAPSFDSNTPIALHFVFLEAIGTGASRTCEEQSLIKGFTSNDYRLLVANNLPLAGNAEGWAYAYARSQKVGGLPPQRVLWDRFFGETIVVNTAGGWARGWNHWQQWGKIPEAPGDDELFDGYDFDGDDDCDYARDRTDAFDPADPDGGNVPGNWNDFEQNDFCLYGPDNSSGQPIFMGTDDSNLQDNNPADADTLEDYWPIIAPTNFFGNYFTDAFKFQGAKGFDTVFSITPIDVRDRDDYEAVFSSNEFQNLDYDYDGDLFDVDENIFNFQSEEVDCYADLTINELTTGRADEIGLDEGWVHFFCDDVNSDAAIVMAWDRFNAGGTQLGWSTWVTHERTTVDDWDLQNSDMGDADLDEDYDPDAEPW